MIENLPGEIWKDIPGFEKYRVSNMGRVGSLMARTGCSFKTGAKWELTNKIQRTLSGAQDKEKGYIAFHLIEKGKHYTRRAHTLVMLTFVGFCPAGMEVCHNDGDPGNNTLENLRYDTHSNNMFDAIGYNDGVYRQSSISKELVIEIRKMARKGIPYSEIARLLGISAGCVRGAALGKTFSHIMDVAPLPATEKKERNKRIRARREEGFTLLQIANEFSLSESAVSRICAGDRSG